MFPIMFTDIHKKKEIQFSIVNVRELSLGTKVLLLLYFLFSLQTNFALKHELIKSQQYQKG